MINMNIFKKPNFTKDELYFFMTKVLGFDLKFEDCTEKYYDYQKDNMILNFKDENINNWEMTFKLDLDYAKYSIDVTSQHPISVDLLEVYNTVEYLKEINDRYKI